MVLLKKSNSYKSILSGLLLLPPLSLGLPLLALADAGNPFFASTRMVRDVFGEKNLEDASNRELGYFAPRPKKEDEEQAQTEGTVQKTVQKSEKPKALAGARSTVSAEEYDINELGKQARLLKSKEDIVKLYGNPNEPMPVLARPDAPKPLQAVQQAMALGDKELAFSYARQYLRYLHDIDATGNSVYELIQQAQIADKIEDYEGKQVSTKDIEEYVKHLQKEQEIQDPATKAIVEQARRQMAREQGQKDITPDISAKLPPGAQDLYYFFDPRDSKSKQQSQKVAALHKHLGKNAAGTHLIGMTPDVQVNERDLAVFRKATGAEFPVLGGQALIRQMSVKTLPALISVDRTNGQSRVISLESHVEQIVQDIGFAGRAG